MRASIRSTGRSTSTPQPSERTTPLFLLDGSNRPLGAGKIAVQAKRYAHPVSVSTIRDLYGTVISAGASKGVLITTATFSKQAEQFAQGKPIELLDGNALRNLIRTSTNVTGQA